MADDVKVKITVGEKDPFWSPWRPFHLRLDFEGDPPINPGNQSATKTYSQSFWDAYGQYNEIYHGKKYYTNWPMISYRKDTIDFNGTPICAIHVYYRARHAYPMGLLHTAIDRLVSLCFLPFQFLLFLELPPGLHRLLSDPKGTLPGRPVNDFESLDSVRTDKNRHEFVDAEFVVVKRSR